MYDPVQLWLSWVLSWDRTIVPCYYLTGSPIYENGKRLVGKTTTNTGEAKSKENVHLVTYDISFCKNIQIMVRCFTRMESRRFT